ncbi:MAG TPA: TorF family putative porin [Vicinamibacterales bacterium]|nr:TorF family putative porin [Vicinamibacterales bacterium]
MTIKFNRKVLGGGLLGAALLAGAPSAFAGATGNVGAFSEYMFRGIGQSGGAAVQGGLDYAHDSGFYAGTWASNIGFGGGTEMDLYGGFTKKFGEVGFDIGGIYYWYTEEDEADAELNTFEGYVGLSFGPVAVKYYYADEANFFIGDGDAEEAGYLLGTLALPITDSLNFTSNVGWYSGDEIERFTGDEDSYIDYSIGLAKTIDGGFTMTLQFIDTDLEVAGVDDEPKVVVGLKKTFEL